MNRAQRRADKGAVHNIVAETAKEFAGVAYEILAAGNNDWYRANPSQRMFIVRTWQTFVEAAREKLVDLLTDPNTHDNLKEVIATALMNDGALNPPRTHAERAVGLVN